MKDACENCGYVFTDDDDSYEVEVSGTTEGGIRLATVTLEVCETCVGKAVDDFRTLTALRSVEEPTGWQFGNGPASGAPSGRRERQPSLILSTGCGKSTIATRRWCGVLRAVRCPSWMCPSCVHDRMARAESEVARLTRRLVEMEDVVEHAHETEVRLTRELDEAFEAYGWLVEGAEHTEAGHSAAMAEMEAGIQAVTKERDEWIEKHRIVGEAYNEAVHNHELLESENARLTRELAEARKEYQTSIKMYIVENRRLNSELAAYREAWTHADALIEDRGLLNVDPDELITNYCTALAALPPTGEQKDG